MKLFIKSKSTLIKSISITLTSLVAQLDESFKSLRLKETILSYFLKFYHTYVYNYIIDWLALYKMLI